jgi:CheY-like chemotaxis protein
MAFDRKVHGDSLLLKQILMNLTLNAIQYTKAGMVEIRFFDQAPTLCFSIKDTGVGIPEAEQAHIFKEFYRSDQTRSEHEGLGLGLTIVARLCRLIGTTVNLESTPGHGSTFTVSTPCPFISEVQKESNDRNPSGSALEQTQSILFGKHIAVIDDDENILDAYHLLLASQGAVVLSIPEADADLQAQLEHIDHIDCILCDYRLKQTTGDVVIEKLRENYNTEIPAIIVTGDTSPRHISIFEKMNVPVLYKPVTFQDIVIELERVLSRH